MPDVRFAVKMKEEVIDRDIVVRYLVIIDWHNKKIGDLVHATPTSEFNKYIVQTLKTYLNENKLPEAEIAPAIMNIADGYITGREIVLKAGDYYSLQNHFRNMKNQNLKSNTATMAHKKNRCQKIAT